MRLPLQTDSGRAAIVERGLAEFLCRWGDEPWFIDARQTSDAAGYRLEVDVNPKLYADQLPRRLKCGCYLIVRPVTALERRVKDALTKASDLLV